MNLFYQRIKKRMANDAYLRLRDRLLSLYQYLLPQHTLSKLMYHLSRQRIGWLARLQIRGWIWLFGVNMEEAELPHPKDYPHFNAFFTRALREGARPSAAAENAVICPIDGRISQIGTVRDGQLLQAKGWNYSLVSLLGGSATRAAPFHQGQFVTLYLAPKDYHRIHMPLAGRLQEMVYLPGRLFSVSPLTVNGVPRLFARNERVVNIFDTTVGPMAVVLVGAILVGSIETVWAGQITPPYRHQPHHWAYAEKEALWFEKGQEIGRFNMGSTVILIAPPASIQWRSSLHSGARVQMGETIGQLPQAARKEEKYRVSHN
jgi:phosphatidylserine decarboxylase